MNDLYLTDEDIHALEEPTWEEQEIEKLKKEKKELENKLEESECKRKNAIEYIKDNITYYYDEDLDESVYQDEVSGDKLLNILDDNK